MGERWRHGEVAPESLGERRGGIYLLAEDFEKKNQEMV